ncbi:MAG: M3 family metallopeptidase [Xanthobacteraceae bacterium]|nr:M3 family metallopeptidase [Xanthobacteraceae bacterium]
MSTPESPSSAGNPLLEAWSEPFGVPPFAGIRIEHFDGAFDRALAAHRAEIAAIAADPAEPAFDNTIAALERSGRLLARVSSAFYVLSGAHTSEPLMAVEREVAPLLAKHWNDIYLDAGLYGRVDALAGRRAALGLTAEQARVLERYHLAFRRAGAALADVAKRRLAEIAERLATLGTAFGQNVLADEQAYGLVLAGEDDLAGLPDSLRDAARSAAEERGLPGKHVITLSRSLVEPFLQFSARRDLREKVFEAWIARGAGGGAHDNRPVIAEIVALRTERARLLGYPDFAAYRLDDTMAKTPAAVRELLDAVWAPARRRVGEEREALQAIVRAEGGNFHLAPWDWRYYAEKLRKARYDLDEDDIKPYLRLENVIAAAFHTAERLFGLSFAPLADVPVWHPDVRVWEVRRGERHVGLFFGDYFARASKRSGAWMTTLRDQERLDGEVRPLVVNVMNFAKAAEGEPTLLSFEDARTLFHEFGHALHGLLSDVTYPLISGTGVLQDFVELPSQLYEHWLERPEILRAFARHAETGAPMPEALLSRLIAARSFNQGFVTAEYLGSSYVDLAFHAGGEATDAAAVERDTRARLGMPEEVVLRHRPTHFQHIFAGEGYAAGYYGYMWSEVLDADAFRAFEEAGDVFDPALAKRLHDHIYAAGGARDPREAYLAFRGRLPTVDALLARRGLADAVPAGEA